MNDVGKVFRKIFLLSATIATTINGFRKTELYPVNNDVYEESDFIVDRLGCQVTRPSPIMVPVQRRLLQADRLHPSSRRQRLHRKT